MRALKQMLAVAVFGLILAPLSSAFGQESYDRYIELLRSDIQTQKVALLTEALELSDEQGAAFWPVYREYETKLAGISDRYITLIKDFAGSFESMTDEKAKELAETSIKIEEDRIKLRKDYFKKFDKQVNSTVAARWLQLERTITNLILLQVQTELPLIP
jgi:hypothetical protein